jgi:class 3 adenylate cyclase
MPLYLDRHDLEGATAESMAVAHVEDLELQGRFDVKYVTYWFDYDRQRAFCLAHAPDAAAVAAVHAASHGGLPNDVIEVDGQDVARFLGPVREHAPGTPYVETAFRIILFTDIVGSTRLTQELGDRAAMTLLRDHDRLVQEVVAEHGGNVVKHTGDGSMVSFAAVSAALEAAMAIQRRLTERNAGADHALAVRIGLAAGEPVMEGGDLFGAAVQLAARLCDRAGAGSILVSSAVRDLAVGKTFTFGRRTRATLKGFPEAVTLYELEWMAPDTGGSDR